MSAAALPAHPDAFLGRRRGPFDEFFDLSTWVTAIIGAVILLVVYRVVTGRGGGHPAGAAMKLPSQERKEEP